MPIRGHVSHLDLNVSDPERSLPFYALLLGYLGFERHDIPGQKRAWWALEHAAGGHFGIEIRLPAKPAASAQHERYTPGIDHLAFHAESREDVDRLHRLLIDAGIDVGDPPTEYDYAPGYYALALDDPDGIRLEVVYDPTTNP